jgi:hypothetical protein
MGPSAKAAFTRRNLSGFFLISVYSTVGSSYAPKNGGLLTNSDVKTHQIRARETLQERFEKSTFIRRRTDGRGRTGNTGIDVRKDGLLRLDGWCRVSYNDSCF